MDSLQWWELASYVVTVFAAPFAIMIFWMEQRRDRQNDEEEIYQALSDEYAEFCKLLLANADLKLMSYEADDRTLTEEEIERKRIIFDILISLFERAFILVYEEDMNKQTQRLWASWDDYIRFWCRRNDFRSSISELLQGEDPEFGAYMHRVLKEVAPGRNSIIHQQT